MSYQDRLNGIHILLKDPAPELVSEGYDLLFILWRENINSPKFVKDLKPIAQENKNLIPELESRLDTFISKPDVLFIYKNKLESLSIQMSEDLPEKATDNEHTRETKPQITISDTHTQKVPFWKNKFLVTAICIAAIFGIIDLIYVLPINEKTTSLDSLGLKLSYKAPVHLSQYDENTVDVSVENSLSTDFKGTISLIIVDPDSTTKPLPGEKLSKELDIDSLEEETKQFKFLMAKKPSSQSLDYQLKITPSNGSQSAFLNENFLVAPIPYLRTASNWLFVTLGTLIVALLLDQIKKLLGFV